MTKNSTLPSRSTSSRSRSRFLLRPARRSRTAYELRLREDMVKRDTVHAIATKPGSPAGLILLCGGALRCRWSTLPLRATPCDVIPDEDRQELKPQGCDTAPSSGQSAASKSWRRRKRNVRSGCYRAEPAAPHRMPSSRAKRRGRSGEAKRATARRRHATTA